MSDLKITIDTAWITAPFRWLFSWLLMPITDENGFSADRTIITIVTCLVSLLVGIFVYIGGEFDYAPNKVVRVLATKTIEKEEISKVILEMKPNRALQWLGFETKEEIFYVKNKENKLIFFDQQKKLIESSTHLYRYLSSFYESVLLTKNIETELP